MIIRLCRIHQRSHSITSGTLMSRPSLVFCSIVPTLTTTRRGGTRCVSISVCNRVQTRLHTRGWAVVAVPRRRRAQAPASKTHVDEARNCGLHSTALLAVRRFNWRSPIEHSSTSKMNYHRDTRVFTDDKDIFHVVNPPEPVYAPPSTRGLSNIFRGITCTL